MGRRRKQVVKIVKKKLPELYLCPNCGKNSVRVNVNDNKDNAGVVCASCDLRARFPIKSGTAGVDAYCLFIDNYYGVEEETTTIE